MVKRTRGNRGGHSRQKLRKHREKTTINDLLKEFSPGDRVVVDIDSSVQDAMPHPRYQGREGVVKSQRGSAYEISIVDGKKEKILITTPVHLKRVQK